MSRVRAIARLLQPRGPSAIPRRIWAIVVDAVNRMPWRWLRSHIAKKRLEAIEPFCGHVDTPRAVSTEAGILRIAATLFRRAPRDVFGCPSVLGCGAMSQMTSGAAAPAPSGISSAQHFGQHHLLATAIAAAEPCGARSISTLSWNARRWSDDGQLAESHADHVDSYREHSTILARLRFNLGPRPRSGLME
jgi:hypothetical protein